MAKDTTDFPEDPAKALLRGPAGVRAAQVPEDTPSFADAVVGVLDLEKVATAFMEKLSFYGLHLIAARAANHEIQIAQLEAAMDALNSIISSIPPLADRFARLRADSSKVVSFLRT